MDGVQEFIHFLSFQYHGKSGQNIDDFTAAQRRNHNNGNFSTVASTGLVPQDSDFSDQTTSNSKSRSGNIKIRAQNQRSTSHGRETKVDGRSFVKQNYQARGFSDQVSETLCSARANTTYRQYSGYIQKWEIYCHQKHIDPRNPHITVLLEFLQGLQGGISAISTAKAALGTYVKIDGKRLGENEDVHQFMVGKARLMPRQPKYVQIWDPQIVFDFLLKWSPAKFLSLIQLAMKTATMILLVSGQRPQILKFLSIENMQKKKSQINFVIPQNLKHSRKNTPATQIKLLAYPGDKRICVVNYVNAYLARTEKIRKSQSLFITSTPPYEQATLSTMARWVKTVLKLAGIDTTIFAPGSTRAASANAAHQAGVPLNTIMEKSSLAEGKYVQ